MRLVRLIYISQTVSELNEESVANILSTASRNNKEKNITGHLCFNQSYFLQCLEGGSEEVNAIYHKIMKDPRHHHIRLIDFSEIEQRFFINWSAGLNMNSQTKREVFFKYSASNEFDPYTLSAQSTRLYLKELSDIDSRGR